MTLSFRTRSPHVVGFALSFLDVLCCGLGASILLLFIVKHGPAEASLQLDEAEATQLEKVFETLDLKIAQKEAMAAEKALTDAAVRSALDEQEKLAATNDEKLTEFRNNLALLSDQRKQRDAASDELRALIAERETQLARSELEKSTAGESGQLAGLRIADDRVVILLDSSASMLDPTLVEIVRLRVSPVRFQQASEKWKQARAAAAWAATHVKDRNKFQVFYFSDKVDNIDGYDVSEIKNLTWLLKGIVNRKDKDIKTTVNKRQASGPTNLRLAFETVSRLEPPPQQIILVTDGLPTIPGSTSLARISGCRAAARAANPILSPACRASIFRDATTYARTQFRNVRIDVILLPLEGDASATLRYWELALTHSGRLLTPATGWPH